MTDTSLALAYDSEVSTSNCCMFPVSPTVEDFRKRLGMSTSDISNLKKALEAVQDGDERALASLGMPPSAWSEMSFMFAKLIKSGFNA